MSDYPKVTDLPSKPLVEALLEIRWDLESAGPVAIDRGYPFAVGRLYDRIRDNYPIVEELSAASVPDAMTPHVVKYRFRVAKDSWPVVQIGPGIATLNYTDSYSWDLFRASALSFAPSLVEAYAEASPIKPSMVLARWINAIQFDPGQEDVVEFLAKKFHTTCKLPEGIENYGRNSGAPAGFNLRVARPLKDPDSVATLQISTGVRNGSPALIWELHVLSQGDMAPGLGNEFEGWLDSAHTVIEDWFFSLIEGELYDKFMEKKGA